MFPIFAEPLCYPYSAFVLFIFCDEAKTCAELRDWGLADSVQAELSPLGDKVYWVYCNLTEVEGHTGVQAVTIIGLSV